MKLRKNSIKPLRFDPSGALSPEFGIDPLELRETLVELASIRDEMTSHSIGTPEAYANSSHPAACAHEAFITLPDRLLTQYASDRRGSELGRLFKRATYLHAVVDRVVVIGIDDALTGAKSILETCCQPYWNELSRADRGSKPRMVFEDSSLDNDALQGLIHLLEIHKNRIATCELDRWALVVLSTRSESLQASVPLERMLDALDQCTQGNKLDRSQLLISIIKSGIELPSRMHSDSSAIDGSQSIFEIPSDVSQSFSILSAVGLVPAALLGVNVIELLQGASAMTKHFAEAPAESNTILLFAAVNHLLRTKRGIHQRVMCVWSKTLESFGRWHSVLVAERLGIQSKGINQMTVVNPRDLHSYRPQFVDGARDKVFHHLIPEHVRFDPLASSNGNSMPEMLHMQFQETLEQLSLAGRPSTRLTVSCIDELHMGQLFQMMMLATAVEAKLVAKHCEGVEANTFFASKTIIGLS